MSLPPERISIKRRRQEEPVETLYLEHEREPGKKRRVTDFYFQRLRDNPIAPISQRDALGRTAAPGTKDTTGVPTVRSTEAGDEIRDFENFKARQQQKQDAAKETASHKGTTAAKKPITVQQDLASTQSAPSTPAGSRHTQQPRRFHLARNLSNVLSPSASGGIRKSRTAIRPPLATFVERKVPDHNPGHGPLHKEAPVDRLLHVAEKASQGSQTTSDQEPTVEDLHSSPKTIARTFVKPKTEPRKVGTSIKDHPSTWDYTSDQLAEELMAFAMECDPSQEDAVMRDPATSAKSSVPVDKSSNYEREDDFVYETYIRVRSAESAQPELGMELNTIGVLVIEEEDEALWQKYIDSDDDEDWDEEDSNAEDNPANDYPEDEVSSDDEYGFNVYKHRRYGSDQEEYGDDGDDKW